MKTKILVLILLLVTVVSITKTNATMTMYSDTGEGTTLGALSVNQTNDAYDYGYGEYDPYLLGGLTVNYNISMGALDSRNGSSLIISAPTQLNFYGGSTTYSYNGSFPTYSFDTYINMAFYASYYSGGGISVYLVWHV